MLIASANELERKEKLESPFCFSSFAMQLNDVSNGLINLNKAREKRKHSVSVGFLILIRIII